MSNKEENVENDIKEEKNTPLVDEKVVDEKVVDEKVDEEIRKDEENVHLIKKEKIKKINDEEFNKRVKEIFNAGQDYDSEELSDTYSYRSSCSTCRSDSTHYHLQ
jgi:hypothetical protein